MHDAFRHGTRARLLLSTGIPLSALLLTLSALHPVVTPAGGALSGIVIVVNSTADIPDQTPGDGLCDIGTGICTLRAAVQEGNAQFGGVTIQLQANTTYTLARAGDDNDATNGDLDVTSPLTIAGAGPESTIINGNGSVTGDRVFHVLLSGVKVISGVSVVNGAGFEQGGGIKNIGHLVLINSTVRNNAVAGTAATGGGIFSSGHLTVTNSSILSNTATGDGGGIYHETNPLVIVDSTLGWNAAAGHGGGLYNFGNSPKILRSTIRQNSATNGGGLYAHNAHLGNSTVSGNSTTNSGAGIYAESGIVNVHNATIAANLANSDGVGTGSGGGVAAVASADFYFSNSIVAANYKKSGLFLLADDCAGTLISSGYNILAVISNSPCTLTGSYTLTNPLLLPLKQNGGATETHALASGSPAIDAGDPFGCRDFDFALLLTDQRGRLRDSRCDIGAFEYVHETFLPVIRR